MTGLTHVRLIAGDLAPMLAFYRDALGFKVVVDVPGTYVELDTGAARIGIAATPVMAGALGAAMRGGGAGGDAVLLQLSVADVDAAADLLRARGVAPVTEPRDQAAWMLRVCHVRDPAGTLIELAAPIPGKTRT